MGVYFREAIKNIRANFLLNLAIVVLIVSVMTFLGIVSIQVQISDLTASVVLNQEAFVELSQYQFWMDGEVYNRLVIRRNVDTDEWLPEEEAYIYYPLSKDPLINMQYVSNSDKFWNFYRKLKSIPGVYVETIRNVGYNGVEQHDAYTGHYTYDVTRDYVVTLDFFDIEKITFLKGRAPCEDDFYIDDDGIQVVPIVVGYQLRDYFELGDVVQVTKVFKYYDPDDPKDTIADMHKYSKGKVVGILEPSNTVTDRTGSHFYHVFDSIIRVIKDINPDDFPELKSSEDVYVYVSFHQFSEICNAKIYINKTNEEQAAEEIRNAVKEAGLEELLVLTKVDGYAKISAALEKGRAESYLQVAFCVGMLCVFGLGMLIVMLNVANSKDYAIHHLVGATKRDVALMTTVQMLILLLVSDVLIHYPYLLSKTGLFLNGDSMLYIFSGERKIYIVIAVLNISVLLLTYIISRVYAAKNDVSATIKDKE